MSLTTNVPAILPHHVAIIMDGNGRWAKQRGKLRIVGHHSGVKAVRAAIRYAIEHQISALTLYAFSSENWNRPSKEVSGLMSLFVRALSKEVTELQARNVQLRIIGDKSRFSEQLQMMMAKAEADTAMNTGLVLNIAANYGGRWDITQAAKAIATRVLQGNLALDEVTEAQMEQHICLNDLPPVDLVIRTGGEHRISNYLLWQIAYAEFYFTDVLWPDFDETTFNAALKDFAQRERRFGATEPV